MTSVIYKQTTLKRSLLLTLTWIIFGVIFLAPLSVILIEGFSKGLGFFWHTFANPVALSALKLTIFATVISVFLNIVFGIMAAWCVTKYDFIGKSLLTTLIDLPFSISPIIVGLIYTLLYGSQSILYPFLMEHHLQVIYAVPGIVLATIFVTFPFVARSLISLMQEQGNAEEEAARLLGANGWQIFWHVTFPNIRWALLHGVTMCTARAMGEFGAVSIISGHIEGLTNTLPLQIEILYNEYNATAAFCISIILLLMSMIVLLLRQWCERKITNAHSKTEQ